MRKLFDIWGSIQNYVTVGLAVTTLVCGTGWYITSVRLDASQAAVKAEKEGRKTDHETYKAEQARYEAEALRQKQLIEERSRKNAQEADARTAALLSEYRASLLRYQRLGGAVGRTDLPGASVPEGSDGPGSSPVFPDTVTVTIEDMEILLENTARIKAVQEFVTKEQNE